MNRTNIGKEIKISTLGIVGGTLILALGEMVFIPLPDKTSFSPQHFPEQINLPGWQSHSGSFPKHFKEYQLQTIPKKSYQYTQDISFANTSIGYAEESSVSLSVNIQMHYLQEEQDVKTLLRKYTSLPPQSLTVLSREDIGSYGVLVHQDQLHLSSCITPQGSSIVDRGFNRHYPALQLLSDRLVFWLLGEKPLVENVCLWSHLSIPLVDSSPEKAYLTLEKVWLSWYKHWHPYLVTMVKSN